MLIVYPEVNVAHKNPQERREIQTYGEIPKQPKEFKNKQHQGKIIKTQETTNKKKGPLKTIKPLYKMTKHSIFVGARGRGEVLGFGHINWTS